MVSDVLDTNSDLATIDGQHCRLVLMPGVYAGPYLICIKPRQATRDLALVEHLNDGLSLHDGQLDI
jgi:hypothetical protein